MPFKFGVFPPGLFKLSLNLGQGLFKGLDPPRGLSGLEPQVLYFVQETSFFLFQGMKNLRTAVKFCFKTLVFALEPCPFFFQSLL